MGTRRHNPAISFAKGLPPATRKRLCKMAPAGLTREALAKAYLDEEQSLTSIAKANGCRASTVLFHLALNGIPLRGSRPGRLK